MHCRHTERCWRCLCPALCGSSDKLERPNRWVQASFSGISAESITSLLLRVTDIAGRKTKNWSAIGHLVLCPLSLFMLGLDLISFCFLVVAKQSRERYNERVKNAVFSLGRGELLHISHSAAIREAKGYESNLIRKQYNRIVQSNTH